MDTIENGDAVVMPSRTLMLKGIPPELNNSDAIHTYFSKFGAVLWVNDKYDSDPEAAVVTFFSIADAIAAYMSNESTMEVEYIQKSWFEYSKKCDLCSYKYSSEDSIKQHMMTNHSSFENQNAECSKVTTNQDAQIKTSPVRSKFTSPKNDINNNARLWGNENVFTETQKEFGLVRHSPNQDKTSKDKDRASNEITSLMRKNTDLNDALTWTMKQRDLDRSVIDELNGKLESINFEKNNVEETLKETCKQLDENEFHLDNVSNSFEVIQKDKQYMDNEYVTIKMKNEDLNDSLRRAIEQRDLARSEILTLYTKLQELKGENENMVDDFHAKRNQLESTYDQVLAEKERLENELNARKDLLTENERKDREIVSLKFQIDNLELDLKREREAEREREADPTTKEKLQSLLAENMRLVHDFKAECQRLEDKDQDFKRVTMKYDLLLKEKDRMDSKLNAKKDVQDNKRRISNEISSLKQEIKDLSDKLLHVEEEKHSKIAENFALNGKLHELYMEKDQIIQNLKDECKSIEEKNRELQQVSVNYELLWKDKESLDMKLAQLKQENIELSENLKRTTMQHDLARPGLDALNAKIASLQTEKENIELNFREKSMHLEEKDMELMRITTKYEWLMQETERVDNEVFCLKRQNEDLNDSFNEAVEQRDLEQTEAAALNAKLRESQEEKLAISNVLSETCEQLEAKSLEMDHLSAKCEELTKNKKEFEEEVSSLNRKMHLLNDALSLTETDRDKRQLEIDSLNKKLHKQRIESENVLETLKDERKRVENKDLELTQLNTMFELLSKEKERLDNTLKGRKNILQQKETEYSQLKRKTEMLNSALCRVEKEKDLGQMEIDNLNEKLKSLKTEKEKAIENMKEECKRSEENELEFKRINVKYEILQKEKARLDIELKGKFSMLKEKERMNNEIQMLNQKNEELNHTLITTIQQRDKERLEIKALNVKLRELQGDTEKVVSALKAKSTQIEEKDDEIKRFSRMYETVMNEKGRLENELKAKGDQVNDAVTRLTQENRKINEELQFKEQLLQNIKRSFNISTPKKTYKSP